jgi:cardiolipin synthase (CMP-forming)
MRVTANQVTIARLLGLPLLAYLAYGGEQMRVLAVIVGTVIGLTDFVDGHLARKHGTTVLGSLLDPVADKVFIVVCYATYADLGGISWWIAAAILSRELLVTVLRSSLELRGRRLPSSVAGKAKTWVQMLGIGFVVLVSVMKPTYLPLLFAVPLGAALLTIALLRVIAHRRFRPIEFAALVLIGFLTAALIGPIAARVTVLGFVILITWYSAADYLTVGVPELLKPDPQRWIHWARLIAGGLMPVVALAGIGPGQLPAIPIIILLSCDMARGALDNFFAHRGIADFSWTVSLWAEVALLAAAMLSPGFGNVLTTVAMLVAITETIRTLARHLRSPSRPPAPAAIPVQADRP